MVLRFDPPKELIEGYLNRPSPGQIASEGMNKAFETYVKQKAIEDAMKLKQGELDIAKQTNARQGREQFFNYGDMESLSPAMQSGITQPQQGPSNFIPPEQVPYPQQQQAVLGQAQGPVQPTGMEVQPQASPLIQRYKDFLRDNPNGLKGQQFTEDTVLQKDSKGNVIGQSTYKRPVKGKTIMSGPQAMPAGSIAKPQLRVNQFTGENEWYTPPAPGQTPAGSVVTPGNPSHGPGTFRDVGKAAGSYAEDQALVSGVLSEIARVKELNKNSRGGFVGNMVQKGQSALNMGTDSPEFKNTADVANTLKGAVSRVLKSTFGGQLSDSEREYLNEVYGAAERMTPQEREIAMDNVTTMLKNKVKTSGAKFNALSGNTPINNPTQALPSSGGGSGWSYVGPVNP